MRRCTHCGMEIQSDVTICPYCFSTVEATKLCPHCGTRIKPGNRFCSFCEAPLPTIRMPDDPNAVLLAMTKDPIEERERHPIRSNPFLAVYLVVVVVIAVVLVWQVYAHLGPGQHRIQMEGILEDAAKNVTGTGDTLSLSGPAAVAAWNTLTGAGIPARIRLGSLQGNVNDLTAIDHVWVMAEVEPGTWVAGDPVIGSTQQAADHPLYYRGWDYASAASAQAALAKLSRYRTLNTTVSAGTATPEERNERSGLASFLASESRNLSVTG